MSLILQAQESRTAFLRERASQRLSETVVSSRIERDDEGHHEEQRSPQDRGEQDMRFGIALGSLKDVVQPDGHVNFFQDVEAGKRQGGTNEEFEDEKKKEQEDYEKKIGYLVYLGQDSIEQSKQAPWYAKINRGRPADLESEVEKVKELDEAAGKIGGLEEKGKSVSIEEVKMAKFKNLLDPLKDIRKYLSTPGVKRKLDSFPTSSKRSYSPPSKKSCTEKGPEKSGKRKKNKKHKKHKKHKHSSKHKKRSKTSYSSATDSSSESSADERKKSSLEKLRRERLEREREEKRRAEKVLANLRGESSPQRDVPANKSSTVTMSSVKQKYNSQFNPHLARQNYDD